MKKSNFIRTSVLMTGFVFLSSCATAPLTITPINPQGLNAQAQGSRVDTLYAQGRDALMAGDLASALELFHGARRAGPEDVRVLNGLGVIYDRLGRYDLSANYYESARAIDPSSTIVQTNLALSTQMRSGGHAASQTAALDVAPEPAKPVWGDQHSPSQEVAAAPVANQVPIVEVKAYISPSSEAAPVMYAQQSAPMPIARTTARPLEAARPPVWTPPRAPSPARTVAIRAQNLRALPSTSSNPNRPTWSRPALIVINSSGVTGHAVRTANRLRQTGWQVAYVGNQRPYNLTSTLVTYGPGQRQQAILIARTLRYQSGSTPTILSRPSSDQIQVRLGRDSAARLRRSRQT